MTWKNEIKKEYRESESLYDDFYELLKDLNGVADHMKLNTKEGDLINKEIMERVVIQMNAVLNALSAYY